MAKPPFFYPGAKTTAIHYLKMGANPMAFLPRADGSQHWITGPEARKLVHQWRAEEDAILVGKNTVLADNPQLNVRYAEGKSPKRVVIDRRLELNKTLMCLTNRLKH
jgi:diaminohydroxyphosphoribosylaminopyrimidine deaminase/5-amino-6-(5-phosphoribosylamino)uracil reductase